MTWAVSGSASCKNKMIENWAQGRGVFLTTSDPRLGLGLPSMLDGRLASMVAAESGSVAAPTAELCWPHSRGVSSSGTFGMATVMRVRSVGGSCKEETRRRGKEKKGRREVLRFVRLARIWEADRGPILACSPNMPLGDYPSD